MDILILIGAGLLIFFVFVGYMYVKTGSSGRLSTKASVIMRRRAYVEKHKDSFAVCNNGTHLDSRDIYVLKLKELGLRGSDHAR